MHAGRTTARGRARTPHVVRLRTDGAQAVADRHGLDTIQAIADFFGVNATTWSRIARGLIEPGEETIAAVLGSHPEDPAITFDALFEVVSA